MNQSMSTKHTAGKGNGGLSNVSCPRGSSVPRILITTGGFGLTFRQVPLISAMPSQLTEGGFSQPVDKYI